MELLYISQILFIYVDKNMGRWVLKCMKNCIRVLFFMKFKLIVLIVYVCWNTEFQFDIVLLILNLSCLLTLRV